MEFLRQYLVGRKASLDVRTLLLFGLQVASALEYLHGQQFVHRDLVKLSDFGLSRALDYDAVYTASRGKLPIKWMAPESINFREFSMASDVWMFGVCCWEIMSWGQKPWTTVSNADVIGEIEAGKRPPCPEACPPALYGYLEKHIWAQQPPKRPLMNEVSQILRDVLEQLKRRVHPEQIRVVRPIQNIPTAPLGDDDENLNRVLRSLALDEETPNGNIPPIHNVSASQLNCVRRAAESIAENVGKLENTYSQQMKHEDFVHGIKEITTRMRIKSSARKLFFVRHGERIDNVDAGWRATAERWDDPYLSQRGHKQASEVGAHLGRLDDRIDHVFTSPFTRCIQTMNGLLSGLDNIPEIHVEPGMGESLNACADPPGRPAIGEIEKMCPFRVDTEHGGDEGCADRVGATVRAILRRYPKGNLLFVSHGSPVASVHQAFIGQWNYVGQCTVGEVIETDGHFEVVRWGDSGHLSDRTNLRDVQSRDKRDQPRAKPLFESRQIPQPV
ncbi:unnamed protein product, partial [Mesorhabditis spiculigera]